jgi:hypothetical protein
MFPIWPNAVKIAETVMGLCGLDDGTAVDLVFSDVDQFVQDTKMVRSFACFSFGRVPDADAQHGSR